ncbi:hypothetical protein DFR60_1099 [Hungatella effluvii]|uniref:Uncharacterized protein n=1 Tax=Hungatella effluvii TaxID=1096246 RepID=A0A2V3Y285_9FIRM|nr:hypothetical protein [Hungatella effluvii]PXX51608.1 hypothetical protein DFR60_1099 [Hungatella effluvii]
MDETTNKAINLLTLGTILIERTRKEDERLKALLSEIKASGESINQCVIHEIINTRLNELFMVREAIGELIDRVDYPDLSHTLNSVRKEIFELEIEISCVEVDLQPYLYCPALEKPEKIS